MLRQDSSASCSENIGDVKDCNSTKIIKYLHKLTNTKVYNELDPIIEDSESNITKSLVDDDKIQLNSLKNSKFINNILLSSVDSIEEINQNIGINVKNIEFTEISETYSSCSSSEFTFNSGNNESHKNEKIQIFEGNKIKEITEDKDKEKTEKHDKNIKIEILNNKKINNKNNNNNNKVDDDGDNNNNNKGENSMDIELLENKIDKNGNDLSNNNSSKSDIDKEKSINIKEKKLVSDKNNVKGDTKEKSISETNKILEKEKK